MADSLAVTRARIAVRKAEARLKLKMAEFKRRSDAAYGLFSPEEVEESEAAVEEAQCDLDLAKVELDALLNDSAKRRNRP